MWDETRVTETPPRYSCYGRRGEQVQVPISGNRAKRSGRAKYPHRRSAVVDY